MTYLDFLYLKAHEAAHILSGDTRERVEYIFKRADGINIPADTRIRVLIVLEHIPPTGEDIFENMSVPELEGV